MINKALLHFADRLFFGVCLHNIYLVHYTLLTRTHIKAPAPKAIDMVINSKGHVKTKLMKSEVILFAGSTSSKTPV